MFHPLPNFNKFLFEIGIQKRVKKKLEKVRKNDMAK